MRDKVLTIFSLLFMLLYFFHPQYIDAKSANRGVIKANIYLIVL
jgi:hypothetical protein